MENIGREPGTNHGSMHGPGYSGGNPLTGTTSLPGGAALADAYHTYAVEWDPGVVRFYVDNTLYETRTPADLPAGKQWVYDHPFFIILNVAVGGGWPGSPDGSTSFPQQMKVDYVRVYKRQ
jgi:beta-glucanase (GH16 family)